MLEILKDRAIGLLHHRLFRILNNIAGKVDYVTLTGNFLQALSV